MPELSNVISETTVENFRYRMVIHHLIRKQLGQGKKITLRVLGDSMYPLIREGNLIHVEKCNSLALSIGDIVTFRKNDIYLTHRVLWIIKKGNAITLITKGDNEINVDPPVSPNHILGKVVVIQRADRTFHLEKLSWRFINRILGVFFLVETTSILFYRSAASKFIPLRTFVLAKSKPSLFYRRLKNRGLHFAARIIM